jgi:hypothetical protein
MTAAHRPPIAPAGRPSREVFLPTSGRGRRHGGGAAPARAPSPPPPRPLQPPPRLRSATAPQAPSATAAPASPPRLRAQQVASAEPGARRIQAEMNRKSGDHARLWRRMSATAHLLPYILASAVLSAGACDGGAPTDPPAPPAPAPPAPAPPAPTPPAPAPQPPIDPLADPAGAPGDTPFRRAEPRPLLTPTEVMEELSRIQRENSNPRASDWERDAGAVVATDPKLASKITALLREPTTSFLTRLIGLSLLATEGSPHGQVGIIEVLSDPGVHADMMFSILVLKLARIDRPSQQLVELTQSLRTDERPEVRASATHALGTQIWSLSVSGRPELAETLAASLAAELKRTADIAEQAALIQALAHGGRPRTWGLVLGFARAKEPALRVAVAKALASYEGPTQVSLLVKLVTDPAREVQSAALDPLHWATLTPAQARTVHNAIVTGRLRPENEELLALFVDRHFKGEQRKAALEAISARNSGDERVLSRVNDLLANDSPP